MEEAKEVTTPTAEEKEELEDEEVLGGKETRWYRGLAARGNYLGLDRPDVAYASKEASRWMSKPREADRRKFRRMGRYLKGFPRVVQTFPWQEVGVELRVYTDADWGG